MISQSISLPGLFHLAYLPAILATLLHSSLYTKVQLFSIESVFPAYIT